MKTIDEKIETVADLIEEVGAATAKLLCALEALQAEPRVNDQLTISNNLMALRRYSSTPGLSDGARTQINGAIEMSRAALGMT